MKKWRKKASYASLRSLLIYYKERIFQSQSFCPKFVANLKKTGYNVS